MVPLIYCYYPPKVPDLHAPHCSEKRYLVRYLGCCCEYLELVGALDGRPHHSPEMEDSCCLLFVLAVGRSGA